MSDDRGPMRQTRGEVMFEVSLIQIVSGVIPGRGRSEVEAESFASLRVAPE